MFLEADTEIYSLQRAYYSSHTIYDQSTLNGSKTELLNNYNLFEPAFSI